MRVIETKVFLFNELNEEAKQKAIENSYGFNTDYGWWDFIYEDAKEIGLKITGFDLDRRRHASGEFILSACEVAQNILNNHGESCETFKTASNFMEVFQPIFDRYVETEEGEDELIEIEDEFLNDLLEDYSILLQNEFEYLESDEAIIEYIEANDYEFTEDGKMIN